VKIHQRGTSCVCMEDRSKINPVRSPSVFLSDASRGEVEMGRTGSGDAEMNLREEGAIDMSSYFFYFHAAHYPFLDFRFCETDRFG